MNDKATPSSRTEASSTPKHLVQNSSSKQVCTKTSLTFGMKLDGITSFPLRSMVLDSSPSNFFALFGRWKMGFIFDFSGKNTCFLGKVLPATSITYSGQFILSKLGAVFSCQEFWGQILGQVVHGKFAPRCNDIQNLILRLMHKWVSITLFPRDIHDQCEMMS